MSPAKQPSVRAGKSLSVIYRYSQHYFNAVLKEYNLGSGQYAFLLNLYNNDGISQGTLTEITKFDKATTARAITKLVSEGYVKREVSETDRREYKLYTTEKAKDIQENLIEIMNQWNQILMKEMTEEEIEFLIKILNKVESNASSYRNKIGNKM